MGLAGARQLRERKSLMPNPARTIPYTLSKSTASMGWLPLEIEGYWKIWVHLMPLSRTPVPYRSLLLRCHNFWPPHPMTNVHYLGEQVEPERCS